jgi:phenylpropionate dioxygenase-like ring-hydroxylating dioxygenase large terminal subunit
MASYPFPHDHAYARNQWYIAAWAAEVGAEPMARTILDQEIVFWRTADGEISALAGLCPHRWAPMATGKVLGDTLQCPYHGAEFDRSGGCVRVPGMDRPPPSLTLRRFPVVELGPCIWIWPGDEEACDLDLLPDAASVGLGGDGWRVDPAGPITIQARPQLLIENLFDQSHLGTVHPSTLTVDGVHIIPDYVEHAVTDARFSVVRELPVSPADEGARAVFPDLDQYMNARLFNELLGVAVIVSIGSHTYAVEADGGSPRLVGRMNFLHGVTPCTAHSTHYFGAMTRDFAQDNDDLTTMLMERNVQVMLEDVKVLEAIEPGLDMHADPRREVHFGTDAAAMQVRQRMMRVIGAEVGA